MTSVTMVFGLLPEAVAEPQAYDAEKLNQMIRYWRQTIIGYCVEARACKRALAHSRDLYERYELLFRLTVYRAQLGAAINSYRRAQSDCRDLWGGFLTDYARRA